MKYPGLNGASCVTVASGLGSPHSTTSSSNVGSALERLDKNGPRAREVAIPAARTEIAIERHLSSLLARDFEHREKSSDAGGRKERQRDAGKVNELCRKQTFRNAHPIGKLEQLARGRALAPVTAAAFARRTALDKAQTRRAASDAQHEVGRNSFSSGERQNAFRIGIIADGGGEANVDAGAREIDRRVERVPAAGEREPAVGSALQFDQHFADTNRARSFGFLLTHMLNLTATTMTARARLAIESASALQPNARRGNRFGRVRKYPAALRREIQKLTGQSV